jgi:hypothetical protein
MVGPEVRRYDRASRTWPVDLVYGDDFSRHVLGEMRIDSRGEIVATPSREDLEEALFRQQRQRKFLLVQVEQVTDQVMGQLRQVEGVQSVAAI